MHDQRRAPPAAERGKVRGGSWHLYYFDPWTAELAYVVGAVKGILRSAVVGWAIICVLTLWPAFLPEPVRSSAAKVDKPVVEAGGRGEAPWEAQLIEAGNGAPAQGGALGGERTSNGVKRMPAERAAERKEVCEDEEQGYFRDDVPLSFELQDVLHTACEANNVPYHVALGLIEVESGFNLEAVSPAGCYGLCQINPQYFPIGLTPAENIEAGMEYLGSLIDRYGDLGAALTAYNAGVDTGDRTYASAVLEAAEEWGH